ncbi:penicillin-binding protein activator LpoB [Fusobacterium mortiferum]|uniref:CsgG/HfaB family protein n=1 Tax=Fusobacterium mortiferum TaxID=850 RepID=UPI00195651B0|nr:penicillin-binding protein activator LpoB [Fusobacterium mortiferum]
MKKYIGIFLTTLLLVGCSSGEVRSSVKKEDNISNLRDYNTYKKNLAPKRRVVIGKVKNYSRFGTQRTDSITKDILVSEFSNSGRFNVLERDDLDSVMEELTFSNSLGEKSILAKQKFLDTDFVVVGSVTKYELNTTGSSSLFSKSKEQRAEAVIELKVIDVLNGKVWTETGEGSSSVKFGTVLGAGTYGSYGSLEQEAFRAAVIQGVEKIVNKIDSMPWTAAVVQKTGSKIIINSGSSNNLQIGTQMNVYKQGKAIEYRGEVLGYEENLVGTAVVEDYIGIDAAILRYNGVDFSLPAVVKLK